MILFRSSISLKVHIFKTEYLTVLIDRTQEARTLIISDDLSMLASDSRSVTLDDCEATAG